jgi:hypothetical protein
VTRGWQGSREINTVVYDSGLISVEQMISALKASGTYIGIAEPD